MEDLMESVCSEPEDIADICDAHMITMKMIDEEKMLEIKLEEEENEYNKQLLEEEDKFDNKHYERLNALLDKTSLVSQHFAKMKDMTKDQGDENEPKNVGKERSVRKRVKKAVRSVAKRSKVENGGKDVTDEVISEKQPKLFVGGVMRDYQIEGFEWMKYIYENAGSAILADEMGLGKTIQCIALIAHLFEMKVAGPYLIIVPLTTVSNWYAEFKRFAPSIPVIIYHGDKIKRRAIADEISKPHNVNGSAIKPVIITSYQIAMCDRIRLNKVHWSLMIVDEAHRIKNFKCKLIKVLKKFETFTRILLTGTPLQNNLAELWSLLNFILPEIFYELDVFQKWFDINQLKNETERIINQEQEKHIVSKIHQILTPYLLRRIKADVNLNLPPKKEIVIYAPLTSLQENFYKMTVNRTIESTLRKQQVEEPEELPSRRLKQSKATVSVTKPKNVEIRITMRSIMAMLRKICAHPYLVYKHINEHTGEPIINENFIKSGGKILVLDRLLPELQRRGHKILIFSQFVMMLKILEYYCEYRGFYYNYLYGETTLMERNEQIKDFSENKDSFVFLLSTRAGGLGINLHAADTVIIYDSDWNPQNDLQAQDRCHRIGQTKPVIIYRLVTENSIEEKIYERASARRKLEKMIIQDGRFCTSDTLTKSQKAITVEELNELLNSANEDGVVKTKDQYVLSPKELEALLDRSHMMDNES